MWVMITIEILGLFLIGLLAWFLLKGPSSSVKPSKKNTSGKIKYAPKVVELNEGKAAPQEEAPSEPVSESEQEVSQVPYELSQFTLIDLDDNADWILNDVLEVASNIKTPRAFLQRLTSSSYDPKEYARIISGDPVIVSRILRVVNSAAFSLSQEINDIQHAIIYLGSSLIKNLTLQLTVKDLFPEKGDVVSQAFQKFWLAGFLSSNIALKLAQQFMIERPSSTATTCLLSYIGNLAFIYRYPDEAVSYTNDPTLFSRIQWEQSRTNANAALYGCMLAKHWELPATLTDAILDNYKLMVTPPSEYEVGQRYREMIIIYFSCRIGEMLAFGLIDTLDDFELDPDKPEHFYLIHHIEKANMGKLFEHLKQNAVTQEVNRTLEMLKTG